MCRDCAAGSHSHAHQRLESGEPPKLNVQIGVEAMVRATEQACNGPCLRRQTAHLETARERSLLWMRMSVRGPTLRRRQAKLARSVGESPTQVMLSRQPGSECCVSRRRRRPRSVHSCCMGCVIEPRNRLLAGAEIVFVIERNRGNAVMRGAARPAGVEEPITCKRIACGTWEVPRLAIGSDALARIGKARSRSR